MIYFVYGAPDAFQGYRTLILDSGATEREGSPSGVFPTYLMTEQMAKKLAQLSETVALPYEFYHWLQPLLNGTRSAVMIFRRPIFEAHQLVVQHVDDVRTVAFNTAEEAQQAVEIVDALFNTPQE